MGNLLGPPILEGNSIQTLVNGDRIYPAMLDAIPNKDGADIAFDVLPLLVGRMRAHPIREFLLDIGTLENYELAQKTWPGIHSLNDDRFSNESRT